AALAGSETPVILHDYPAATGIKLGVDLVARLHGELGHVRAIKLEDPPTGPKVTALRKASASLGILGGLGGMYFLQELDRGADGMMTGFSYPEALVAIHRAHRSGDRERAARLFFALSPLLTFEFQPGTGLALRKEIYRQRGAIGNAHVRHPGAQIDPALTGELQAILGREEIQAALAEAREVAS
ncbi:MAG TPA: dihydrodipicolinate synthase family protein, partial [Deinococcales bacterium]|nr:dihydrodipicolinate synthase family protein [Deinococcales bacterium]